MMTKIAVVAQVAVFMLLSFASAEPEGENCPLKSVVLVSGVPRVAGGLCRYGCGVGVRVHALPRKFNSFHRDIFAEI